MSTTPPSFWSSYPCVTPVPASERPTNVAIPRAPRLPTECIPPAVAIIRYDLENATEYALSVAGRCVDARAFHSDRHYDGLAADQIRVLSEARCAVIMAASRLGGPRV